MEFKHKHFSEGDIEPATSGLVHSGSRSRISGSIFPSAGRLPISTSGTSTNSSSSHVPSSVPIICGRASASIISERRSPCISGLLPGMDLEPKPTIHTSHNPPCKRPGSLLELKNMKKSKTMPREDRLIQCASYAFEMLSYAGFHSYALGLFITNSGLELLYYNRSAYIQSYAVNFQKDPVSLIALISFIKQLDS
ncbi:hypothetical protein AMATHDRAFT_11385 [Amanita thiersii Skay4041]|uniref:Uncharacterized protein n=1 Tax=Amanita thiersii Skay4041 TaxID=703135 RepID=A0A2A9N5R5_9AGAR|nr:hypothetical protein AMATHDRAFT_11385 [Amanita thiersii Skay4041]